MTEAPEITRLRAFLAEHQMSQADLARKLDYTPTYMNKLFCGAAETNDKLRWRFLEAFGIAETQAVFGAVTDGKNPLPEEQPA